MNKKFYKSKTVWFNALTVLIVLATASGYTPNAEVAETTSAILLAIAPVVNLVLRSVTNKGVTL